MARRKLYRSNAEKQRAWRERQRKPRLLDLFCGAGGASQGYALAGFEVTGVDLTPQPHYPYAAFIQADALTVPLDGYDVIHASPPCQGYSALKLFTTKPAPLLIDVVRARLIASGKPYVIENVRGAASDLWACLLLCGSMFGLQTSCGAQLRRHRLFESNVMLMSPGPCQHVGRTIGVFGGSARDSALERRRYRPLPHETAQEIHERFSMAEARQAMGITWMNMAELAEAIPPAYTQWIGEQLRDVLSGKRYTLALGRCAVCRKEFPRQRSTGEYCGLTCRQRAFYHRHRRSA
jgi:DNA (cytosine-5)-methyltransferase 1